jgi:hypothetical protein
VRDGAAVVSVRGRGERHRAQRGETLPQRGEGMPGLERFAEAFFERAVNRPGRAENLKCWQPETARLDLQQHLADTEHLRELRRADEWCRRVAVESLVELQRRAADLSRRAAR